MREKIIAANWKMNGNLDVVHSRLKYLVEHEPEHTCDVVLFPSAVYLPLLQKTLTGSQYAWGGQTVSEYDDGAYTGEISATMQKEFGASWVIIGHSERRQYFRETDEQIAEKLNKAIEEDLRPILCVGETEAEYDANLTQSIIEKQISAVLSKVGHVKLLPKLVVAYEPVWAIGTGKTATPEYADDVHQFIRSTIAKFDESFSEKISILYGGSVKASNAAQLFAMPNIDGALIGGAALDAQQFLEIVQCIK